MKLRLTQRVVCAAIGLLAVPSPSAADPRPLNLMIGLTFAHMKFDDPGLTVSWRGNAVFGVDFGVPLFAADSKVQLRGEILLVPRGGNVDDGQFVRKIKLLYIDAAALIDVEVNPSFHLLAGTSLGIRAGTGAASVNGIGVDITGVFRPIDVGVTVGADMVVVPRKIQLQVLYTHGLMNILSDDPYTPIFFNSTSPAKNQTLLIMVAPSFWR